MTATDPATEVAPLLTSYDGLVCDLDGVVYRGAHGVPGAVETLERTGAGGVPVVFATNNASRPPAAVAAHLGELGLGPGGWSVVTSSQAAASYLAARLDAGTAVCAVGGPGVGEALVEAGLRAVPAALLDGEPVAAVVQGLGTEVTWSDLAEVARLVRDGALWVATNLDIMLPTGNGPAPGNGALVAAVRTAVDAEPHVVGKPGADLFDLARARLGTDAARTLVCGDRLDTDIEGAAAAGLDSLFVLSGASTLQELAFASGGSRPTYVAHDLTGLLRPALRLTPAADGLVGLGGDAVLRIRAEESPDLLLPALVCTAWHAIDRGLAVSTDPAMWRELEERLGLTAPVP